MVKKYHNQKGGNKNIVNCCNHSNTDTQCVRSSDNKVFKLPRRFSRDRCLKGIKGFTMRSSCAP